MARWMSYFFVVAAADELDNIHHLPPPMVITANGPVIGFDRQILSGPAAETDGVKVPVAVSTFWALPFAEPPLASKRFHYATPLAASSSWGVPRLARQLSKSCPQNPRNKSTESEDCLYLNVYTPRSAPGGGTLLPVMFWLYGGGFRHGDAYQLLAGKPLYDGGMLAANHDVVIVTSNYRTGLLGFNTYTKGPNGETGTQALDDQRLALRWTSENIRAFGGDPSRVTIFGESAGAMSVLYHLVSPPSWPYFSKAIMQSGSSKTSWLFQPKADAAAANAAWAEAVGCPASDHDQLECLQALPGYVFVNAPEGVVGGSPLFGAFPVGPIVDGTAHGLLDVPINLVAAGMFAKVPLMLGANKDDGSLFVPTVFGLVPGHQTKMPQDSRDNHMAVDWCFGASQADAIFEAYPDSEYTQSLNNTPNAYQQQFSQVIRDAVFQCSNRALATQWHAHGVPVFLYTFAFDFGELDKYFRLGDFHASDLPFVWRNDLWLPELVRRTPGVARMGEIMSCLWASFALTADPNGSPEPSLWLRNCGAVHGNVTAWPAFGDRRLYYNLSVVPTVLQLRANNTHPDDEFPSDVKCDLWDQVLWPWHPVGHGVDPVWL